MRNLVELHNGTIEVHSELEKGTRVSVRMPAAAVQAGPPAVKAPAADGFQGSNGYVAEALQWLDQRAQARPDLPERPLILVAGDNADMRLRLQRVLGSRSKAESVGDWQAALDFIRRERPDLLVTDALMPTLDGFGLVSAIRADQELATLPVIMLSARAGLEAAGEGFSAGADDYRVKPFRSQELINRVAARLEVVSRAMERAERDQRSTDRLSALSELAGALAGAATMPDALEALLASPMASLGATDAAVGLLEKPTA